MFNSYVNVLSEGKPSTRGYPIFRPTSLALSLRRAFFDFGACAGPAAPVEGALVAKMSSVSGGFHQWGYPWLPPNGWLMENP